ncbi:AfsA-related hotdog domain-containing protein [Litoreibacter janthinus]|uniref:A-factor biosynthesis hotdog domain-containing protein n=1 Tax=Litoreibacter janthinus TaxID=670154 RepID=A0A1I6GDB9_9RHOB|nr:AfsA-related hotdog domain-containing protein [Litoreibacter janthinus]SFR40185.1 A-factor biosynthesis hotdog domain-containing protein [Litoreibacter janthinus]
MSALDRRMHPKNAVLRHCRRDGNGVARLIVDKTHPFFFDHPLDHVPGLLLLEGAVQAAQARVTAPSFVSAILADFKQYTFIDKDILLHTTVAKDSGSVICTTEFEQDSVVRASIRVTLTPTLQEIDQTSSIPLCAMSSLDDMLPCTSRSLNKQRPENVLITTPVLTDQRVTAQLLPLSDKCLFSDSAETVHPLYLLEAFMQVQRFLNAHHDGDKRIRDILTGVSFDQSAPITNFDDGVALDGAREFVGTGKNRLARSAWLTSGGRRFAKCSIRTAQVATKTKSKTEEPQPV